MSAEECQFWSLEAPLFGLLFLLLGAGGCWSIIKIAEGVLAGANKNKKS